MSDFFIPGTTYRHYGEDGEPSEEGLFHCVYAGRAPAAFEHHSETLGVAFGWRQGIGRKGEWEALGAYETPDFAGWREVRPLLEPGVPDGCRWCNQPRPHGHQYVAGVGLHQWAQPTDRQRLERMLARREERLAVRGPLDPDMLATITANARTLYRQFAPAGPPCIPNHGVAVWCPGCAYDPSARPRRTPMDLATLRAEIAKLDHLPGDTLIVMSKDGEGNGFSPLADLDEAMYDAESTWAGDRYLSDADREATGEPNEYSEAPESAVPAVFLWPTN